MRERTIVRMRRRRSNWCATKSAASASSKAGCVGGLVGRKSSTGLDEPAAKKCFQTRLTRSRAKSGLSGARANRPVRCGDHVSWCRTCGCAERLGQHGLSGFRMFHFAAMATERRTPPCVTRQNTRRTDDNPAASSGRRDARDSGHRRSALRERSVPHARTGRAGRWPGS